MSGIFTSSRITAKSWVRSHFSASRPDSALISVLAQPLEHRLEREEVGGLVVDQQDVDAVGVR